MAFNLTNTFSQSKKPSVTATPWVRPSDWPTITDNADQCQFLVCDAFWSNYAMSTSFVAPAAQNLYIDWGDGTINTIGATGATTTTHTYATGGTGGTGGTPSSRGYNTWVVKVYTDSGGTVLAPFFKPDNGLGANIVSRTQGVLEIVYGNNVQFNTTTATPISLANMLPYMLECVKLPNVLVGNGATAFQFFNNGFHNAFPSLYKVVMPTSAAAFTDWSNAFNGCVSLQGTLVIPPDCTGITTFSSAFNNCVNLSGITLPPTLPSCSSFSAAFLGAAITSMIFPSLPVLSDFTSAFQQCSNLTYVRFTNLPNTAGCNFSAAFNNCGGLKYVFFPNSIGLTGGNQWTMTNIFNGCKSLETLTFPLGFNTSSLSSVFTQCTNLLSCTFQGPCGSLTNMSTAFSTCTSLQSVTLPTTSGSSVVMTQAFEGCRALGSLSFAPGFNLAGCGNMCINCSSLQTVVLPQIAQPLFTSASQMFSGCTSLTSVTWPTSTTGITTLLGVFSACTSLESMVFPATMNSCTTIQQVFNNCSSLSSVTLPTSMTALTTTGFAQAFSGCQNLQTIVLPATVSTGMTSYSQIFITCGVRTVTLPTTRTTSMTTMQQMFFQAFNLQTVNNMNLIGNNSTVGTLVNGQGFANTSASLSSINLSCRLTKLGATPIGATGGTTLLSSVRLTNTGTGQWTGASPQIEVQFTGLSTAALNTLFADMAAQGTVTGKTINITGAAGAAGLTAADRLVITSRGWTITG